MSGKVTRRRMLMATLAFSSAYAAASKLKLNTVTGNSINEGKMNGTIETKSADLERQLGNAMEVIHLSDSRDSRWAGVYFLPSNTAVTLDESEPSEIFVIKGSLVETGLQHQRGAFLTRTGNVNLNAGREGAVFFVYRQSMTSSRRNVTLSDNDLQWYQGGAEGMKVAPLPSLHHRLSLVSWLPGTRVPRHSHPRGEEIFVLAGELRDQHDRYPAGTWQRLHPDSSHAPYAEVETLILLRNGHL